jgi:hypothetical protein
MRLENYWSNWLSYLQFSADPRSYVRLYLGTAYAYAVAACVGGRRAARPRQPSASASAARGKAASKGALFF